MAKVEIVTWMEVTFACLDENSPLSKAWRKQDDIANGVAEDKIDGSTYEYNWEDIQESS
jgi:hypothetical protein